MPFATRGNLVWLGMILSGVALGVYVLAAWPDTSPQVVRLPYGEAMPKTPRTVAAAQRREIVTAPAATPDANELTAAAPAAVPQHAAVSPPPALEAAAPEESADELGAEPLPGTGQATPKSVQQQQAGAASGPPAAQGPAAEPEPAPEPAPEEPPLLEIIIGSVPPSGPE